MNIAMKLTTDGLVRALRWKALAVSDDLILDRQAPAQGAGAETISNTGTVTSNGGPDGNWNGIGRGSIAEGAL
ncbi:MAG: hypothetical protein NBV76_06335 [Candidatus Ochrobactrum gambitense]|nr:MAG: hypothetical protein NBV76_06335 [Candidatus Ochrobactrum gambitense]WEK17020.1 MAG: hypothetical protein P0Y54_04625 [Candidatus Ochrobactrum gambitense]